MEEYLNLIKKNLREENYESLEELIAIELKENGKLKRLYNLTNEEYEFMLRLITKDENIYKQLEKLKNLKVQKKKKDDLEQLKSNIEETKNNINNKIKSLRETTKTKINIPIIKQIKQKRLEMKNKEILNAKYKSIIDEIEQSKLRSENKELKQSYFEPEKVKDTIDILYKKCELKNIDEVEEQGNKLIEKYEKILIILEKDIEKNKKEYKEKIKKLNEYDKRLVEYTFHKKNNYVTLAIDHLAKENINYKNNTIEIQKKLNHELLIYALISLYKIKNSKIKITILETEEEKTKQKVKRKK